MTTLQIAPEYGYVIGVGFASNFLLGYLGYQVTTKRKTLGVPLPSAYADQSEASKDPQKLQFNCYQRAHQNTLENYPSFLFFLSIGGIKHPIVASVGGLTWIIGRFLYARGYYSGNPDKRHQGIIQYAGHFTLIFCTISTALSILQWI